jgi:hypothetical protein
MQYVSHMPAGNLVTSQVFVGARENVKTLTITKLVMVSAV